MTSRAALDLAFSKSPIVGSEPRTGFYRHIHPDRLRLKGVYLESKVWLKARLRNDTPKPFVIYGRPRSGTTLLVDLLDQIDGLRCDGELLHSLILRPSGFLRDLPKRAGSDVKAYGVKLLSYQLMEVQRILRPLAFFDQLAVQNYTIVHIVRNTWDQNMSLVKAQETGLYFGEDKARSSFRVDPMRFTASLKWNETMLTYEQAVMEHVPHVKIDYDVDLKDANQRDPTMVRICAALGLEYTTKVEATLRPTGGKFGPQKIENLDQILDHVQSANLEHLIPDKLR